MRVIAVLLLALAWTQVGRASLENDGVFAAGTFATDVFADGVFQEQGGESPDPPSAPPVQHWIGVKVGVGL